MADERSIADRVRALADKAGPPPVFFAAGCVPAARWFHLNAARQSSFQWLYSPAEKAHVPGCRICRGIERAFDSEHSIPVIAAMPDSGLRRTKNRRRRALAFACLAASVLAAVVAGVLWWGQDGYMGPPEYRARAEARPGVMGPNGTPDSARAIHWSLPPDQGGVITVVKVTSDGMVTVLPGTNDASQRVAISRPDGDITLSIVFEPPPEGTAVVWLILSDSPAADLLRPWAASIGQGSGQFPRSVVTFLQQKQIQVRAVGQVILKSPNDP